MEIDPRVALTDGRSNQAMITVNSFPSTGIFKSPLTSAPCLNHHSQTIPPSKMRRANTVVGATGLAQRHDQEDSLIPSELLPEKDMIRRITNETVTHIYIIVGIGD